MGAKGNGCWWGAEAESESPPSHTPPMTATIRCCFLFFGCLCEPPQCESLPALLWWALLPTTRPPNRSANGTPAFSASDTEAAQTGGSVGAVSMRTLVAKRRAQTVKRILDQHISNEEEVGTCGPPPPATAKEGVREDGEMIGLAAAPALMSETAPPTMRVRDRWTAAATRTPAANGSSPIAAAPFAVKRLSCFGGRQWSP